jgi:hypothetical protein
MVRDAAASYLQRRGQPSVIFLKHLEKLPKQDS